MKISLCDQVLKGVNIFNVPRQKYTPALAARVRLDDEGLAPSGGELAAEVCQI